MLLAIAALLGVAWLLGFTVFQVVSPLLHLLLVAVGIVLLIHFVRGTRNGRHYVM